MDPEARSRLLKDWAREAGFARAGVAGLEPATTGTAFLAWLARGDQAAMHWLERRSEVRLAPSQVLSGARSVLVVALQYAPFPSLDGSQEEDEPGGDLWPRVARYARGVDYHDLMGERLRTLGERIREGFPGHETRHYVDTGPVLERELAARAGLGAVGKNTNLLHPEAGSWFLLGELFTTLELTADPPVADLCGRCTRCLEACPTGALPAPYRLGSNRCISYWTIEHRGSVPAAVRPLLGDWVFGCDVCQEVCPANAAVEPATDPALRLPAERRELDLVGLLALRREDYVERFRGSPLKRAKLAGLKRNAALAMGNRGQLRYVSALSAALGDEEPLVRAHAAWALGAIGGEQALGALRTAACSEPDPAVRQEINAALARHGAG